MNIKPDILNRRSFLGAAALATGQLALGRRAVAAPQKKPNVLFVFADQWRAQATGYAGDPNAKTPNLDRLAAESVNFTNAVSGCPVCSPYRASLLTGQYWLTHGIFLNDVPLSPDAVTVAKVLRDADYDTGYIGKWHVDGHGRMNYIPPERRQGFDFWRAMECTHDYNNSQYYGEGPEKKTWEGYDAIAQTKEAENYIQQHGAEKPFSLFISWGSPHNPYETAPKEYRDKIRPEDIVLRPNVPPERAEAARKDLAGYYAHIMALDDCMGRLMAALDRAGIADNTILVFTSDHGDMLGSQGMERKQRPYDESIRVPFLLRYPKWLGRKARNFDGPMNTPDIMPTLLGLSGVDIPKTVEGRSFEPNLIYEKVPFPDAALLACITPFGEWTRNRGGREYRGIRTTRYTYVRDLNGPWLLFDNEKDPYQQSNLCGLEEHKTLQKNLDDHLNALLNERKDTFEPGDVYIKRFGYEVDATGTVPVHP